MLKFQIPTKKLYKITQSFGANFKTEDGKWRYTPYHHGVDLRTKTDTCVTGVGLPIVCAQEGKVVKAYNSTSYGLCVIVEHTGKYKGFYTLYAHLSKIDVKAGDEVTIGWQLGLSGTTGASKAPHLHFELRYEKNDLKHVLDPFSPSNPKNLTSSPEYMMCEVMYDDWEEAAQKYAVENKLIENWANPYEPMTQVRFAEVLRKFEIYLRSKYNIF